MEGGSLVGIIGVSTDISEKKRREKAIVQMNNELEVRVAERTKALHDSNGKLMAEVAEHLKAKEELQKAYMVSPKSMLPVGKGNTLVILFHLFLGYGRSKANSGNSSKATKRACSHSRGSKKRG